MDLDTIVKLNIYETIARTTQAPTSREVAQALQIRLKMSMAPLRDFIRNGCLSQNRATGRGYGWRRLSLGYQRISALECERSCIMPIVPGMPWNLRRAPPRCSNRSNGWV